MSTTQTLSNKEYPIVHYMTKDCRTEHLLTDFSVDHLAPWYELHLHEDNTYDSFQKGYQWSKRKPISKAGLAELKRLLDDGSFSLDRDEATLVSLKAHG